MDKKASMYTIEVFFNQGARRDSQPAAMNSAFQEAVSAASRNVQLTHKQQVTRLYRRALRTLDSWVIDREIFCDEADKLRAEFDANRSLSPTSGYASVNLFYFTLTLFSSVVRLMREANEKLHKYTHPDPYTSEKSDLFATIKF